MDMAARYFHRPVSTRVVLGWVLVASAALLLTASRAGAQPAESGPGVVGSSMLAAKQFMGVANRTGVIVRAGAGLGELTVTTLAKGDEVVVVGGTGDYLRILPPEGTFCLVPRARVNIRGDADAQKRTGRVIENTSIRVGSAVNSSIDKSPARLTAGEEVVVIGENNIYYHVEPPKGVFFYVEKRDLAKAREVKVKETNSGWRVSDVEPEPVTPEPDPEENPAPEAGDEADQPTDPLDPLDPLDPPTESADDNTDTDTAPVAAVDESADASTPDTATASGEDAAPIAPPTTQPALVTEFKALDDRYITSTELPLEEQPLEELKTEYEALLEAARDNAAASTIVPVIEARLQTIVIRQEAMQDLQAMQAMRKQLADSQQALEVEQQELSERAEMRNITIYRAVGEIRSSSLQVGGGSLFRLCDPGNGRTIIYLRADGDAVGEVAGLLEKFAGVKGEIVEDEKLSLKYIEVTAATGVQMEQVFQDVAAEIIPPSLVQQDAATQ